MIWFLLFYMWLFIHRPFEVWPALGAMHIELIYVLIITAIWAIAAKKQWMPNALHSAFFAFAAAMLASWCMSPWRSEGELVVENYFKHLVFYILLVTTVDDEKRLKMLIKGFLIIMALYMGHSLWEYHNGRYVYRMGISRMIGVDATMSDPNTFGCSILYSLPFAVPVWNTACRNLTRCAVIGYAALAITCILLTGSREALVGLCLLAGYMVWTSERRVRWSLLAVAATIVAWILLPASLHMRFESIIYPSVGPANARTSAEGRWEGLEIGWELLQANPVAGVGPGVWRPATGRDIESHNLYGQLMGEMGILGITTFLMVLVLYYSNIRTIRRLYRDHPQWGHDFVFHLNHAIGLAVVLLLIEGNFGHNLYRYTWLWYAGFLIVARYSIRRRTGREPGGVVYGRVPRKRPAVKTG